MSKRKFLPTSTDSDYDYGDKRHERWRLTCLARDEYICQNCGATAEHVHHKKEVDTNPELRYDIDNGVSLCMPCHNLQHKDRMKFFYNPAGNDKHTYGESKFLWRDRWTGKIKKRGHFG
jgi:hypothetical protein